MAWLPPEPYPSSRTTAIATTAPPNQAYTASLNDTLLTFLQGIHQASLRPLAPPPDPISLAGKGKKLLKSTNRFPIYGWCGRTLEQSLPSMILFLDSDEDDNTKWSELKRRLKQLQERNPFMRFTLRMDTVREFTKFHFSSEFEDKTIMKGFSPFCIHKLERQVASNLRQLEEGQSYATNKSSSDYNKRINVLKIPPFTDSTAFVTAICNTYALAKVLFSTSSPLTQDLEELQDITLQGFHTGRLAEIGALQTDWFACILWKLHQKIHEFFEKQLTEDDLLEGARLRHPLTSLLGEVECFKKYKIGGVLPSLSPHPSSHSPL